MDRVCLVVCALATKQIDPFSLSVVCHYCSKKVVGAILTNVGRQLHSNLRIYLCTTNLGINSISL